MTTNFSSVVVTAGVHEWMLETPEREDFIGHCMGSMLRGDWGSVCEEDAASNNEALESGARLMGVYHFPESLPNMSGNDTLWIIIEAVQDDEGNRGPMTALFPREY